MTARFLVIFAVEFLVVVDNFLAMVIQFLAMAMFTGFVGIFTGFLESSIIPRFAIRAQSVVPLC